MNYLERYLNGEYEQVWAELLALSGAIREEPLYTDAWAVARETMTRTRKNIEVLAQRLQAIDYKFVSPKQIHVLPKQEYLENMSEIERQVGPLPLSLHVFYEVVGSVDFTGFYPKLSQYVDSFPDEEEEDDENWSKISELWERVNENTQEVISGFPVTHQFVIKMKEAAENLVEHSENEELDFYADPLFIHSLYYSEAKYYECSYGKINKKGKTAQYCIEIAPDILMKAGYSGGGGSVIFFPDLAIDTIIKHDEHRHITQKEEISFVEYLRNCFRWGGFPGLEYSKNPPTEVLEYLTKDLLLI